MEINAQFIRQMTKGVTMKPHTIALVVALLVSTPLGAQRAPQQPVKTADQRALDAAVMGAISRNDLRHARELAVTAEHWQWINDAQTGGNRGPKSGAEVRQEMANSQACKDAQRSYQLTSQSGARTSASVDQARQAVRAACGSITF